MDKLRLLLLHLSSTEEFLCSLFRSSLNSQNLISIHWWMQAFLGLVSLEDNKLDPYVKLSIVFVSRERKLAGSPGTNAGGIWQVGQHRQQ